MKTSRDPRHLNRIIAMQEIFVWEFNSKSKPKTDLGKNVVESIAQIDKEIVKSAPAWPIDQINRVDLAILRIAIFELIIEKKTPFKVIVDEAVEISKEYGTEASPGFMNGALGNIITNKKLDKKD